MVYKKKTGKSLKMSIPQDAVIAKVRKTEILETYDALNPVGEIRDLGLTTFKGPGGTKVDQAFTLKKRAFDPSYYGVFAMSTPDNANAGVVKELTMNCNIQNTLGFAGPVDRSNKSVTSLTAVGEAVMPFVTDYDDPSRIAFTSIQSKHAGGMVNSSLPLVRTGVEKNIQYQTSETFAKLAKGDGVVTSIDEVEKKIYVTYKDGTKEVYDYKNHMLKNSDAFNQAEYECFVKVGQKIGAKDILCGDTRFFKRDSITKEVVYTQAINGLVAISEGSYTEDDSNLICSTFANRMVIDFTKRKQISIKATDTIIEYKKVGDHVELGDPIFVFDESGTFEEEQDEEEDSMFKMLFDNLDKETLAQMIHQTPKAPISGKISDMKVYWTVPIDKMSKTVAKFVKEYINKINKEIREEEAFTGKPSEKRKLITMTSLTAGRERINGCEVPPEGGIVVEFFISNSDTMSTGDKVSLSSALKTVTSQIIERKLEPYTESGRRLDGIFSLISIDARMINSVWYTGWLGKMLYDYSKRFATNFLKEIGADVPVNDRLIDVKK
jgi:DNA-directed RNA polymerase beta subunit